MQVQFRYLEPLRKFGHYAFIGFVLVLGVIVLYQHDRVMAGYDSPRLQIEHKKITSTDSILPVQGPTVKPVLYTGTFSLEKLSTDRRKQKFVDLMLPAILIAKHKMYRQCRKVSHLLNENPGLDRQDSLWLDSLQQVYKAGQPADLIPKLQTHPTSIVLAQAALECGWGTSRFFTEGNNVFGVWSYDPDEPRIKASFMRGDQAVFVKKYKDLSQSVMDYFKTLARVPNYREFREKRMQTTDPKALLPYLKGYSELRELYIKRLVNVIELNDFQKYDGYYLDPAYFKLTQKPQT